MRLYVDSNYVSPYALTAYVSLVEKGLAFEVEPLDLAQHAHEDPRYARTSLTRRVPMLIHEDFALSESSAIAEYLDEAFPGGTRLYPGGPRERARARQVQAWVRSDLMPIREERPTFVVFCGAKRPPLSPAAQAAADKLTGAALAWLDGPREHLCGDWSIADVDLAMMLQRLVAHGDSLPAVLVDYANRQWRRLSVQRWLAQPRPAVIDY